MVIRILVAQSWNQIAGKSMKLMMHVDHFHGSYPSVMMNFDTPHEKPPAAMKITDPHHSPLYTQQEFVASFAGYIL